MSFAASGTFAVPASTPELATPPGLSPPPEFATAGHTATDDEVCAQVWGLLTRLYPRGRAVERRRELRYPFPHLVKLTPVNEDASECLGDSFSVVGRHLSERGLGFFHQTPLPFRHVVATLEIEDGRTISLLLDVSWCRFTRSGWYESGGRFLKVVRPHAA